MNPIRQVAKHPAVAGILGPIIGWRAAGGSLFAQCLAALSASAYLDARAERRKQACIGEARFAAENAAQRGASRDEAIAEAVAAGKACMAGPLFTGKLTPAVADTATPPPPPPRPPSKFWRIFVFTFSAVFAGLSAYIIVRGMLQ